MSELTGTQRKRLRGLAHHLKPVVQVGQAGLSESLVGELDGALESHELVKVKFVELKDRKKELCREMAERTSSHWVGLIGHIAIFYREAEEPRLSEEIPELRA